MSAKPHANVWTDPLTPLVMLKRTAAVFWTRSNAPPLAGRHPRMADPERWL